MTQPLPIVGYINPLVADALRDPTSGINTTQLRTEPNGCVSEPLVFRSDALAKLAEKDAKILRFQKALDAAYELERMRSGKAKVALQKAAQEALKGPEA